MKSLMYFTVFTLLLLTSCGAHQSLTNNTNMHTTHVQLSKNNFKVIDHVEGHSRAVYVLGIGGLTRKALIAKARSKMFDNADMQGKSCTLINENVEIKKTAFPFVRVYKVGVSGQIIEFIDHKSDQSITLKNE